MIVILRLWISSGLEEINGVLFNFLVVFGRFGQSTVHDDDVN